MKKPAAILIASLFLVTTTCRAQADSVDDYIRNLMRWERIPGLSLAVVRDGKVIKAEGYGQANVETNTPASATTVYMIGSVSKQFLAAALLTLVQEGKVGLDDPVKKYLPDVPETWSAITVRNLLTHTSGIVRDAKGLDPVKQQRDEDVIRSVYKESLRFAPGTRFGYSNLNYYCIAVILQKTSGIPWPDFVKQRIFDPSRMKSTRLADFRDVVSGRASGYETAADTLVNAEPRLVVWPSGAFVSTVVDFALWENALQSGQILKASTLGQMWSPVHLSDGTTYGYGFGWFVGELNGHQRIYHSGGVPGFVCEVDLFPQDHLSVILMANIGGRDLEDAALYVAAEYLSVLKVQAEPVLPDTGALKGATVARMVADLTEGRAPDGPLSNSLKAALASQSKSRLSQNLKSFGPIHAVELIEYKRTEIVTSYTFRLSYKDFTLLLDCAVNPEGTITQFNLHD